jgi:hypothetical protein
MAMAAANLPASLATRFLVNLANLRGGGDNISTIVVKVPGEVDRKKSVRMSEPTLKNRSKIDWDWIWLPLLILLLISPLAALFFFMHSQNQDLVSWNPIAVMSTSIIIAGLVILLTGLGKIQLDKYRENSKRKSGSGTVPISRTKEWNIGDQVIEQMVSQSEELMVAGQSILDEDVRVSITDALAKAKISRTAGNLKEAFLAGAAAFTGLAPVIEGMVRFQQIPPCKMIWSRSEH